MEIDLFLDEKGPVQGGDPGILRIPRVELLEGKGPEAVLDTVAGIAILNQVVLFATGGNVTLCGRRRARVCQSASWRRSRSGGAG